MFVALASRPIYKFSGKCCYIVQFANHGSDE